MHSLSGAITKAAKQIESGMNWLPYFKRDFKMDFPEGNVWNQKYSSIGLDNGLCLVAPDIIRINYDSSTGTADSNE